MHTCRASINYVTPFVQSKNFKSNLNILWKYLNCYENLRLLIKIYPITGKPLQNNVSTKIIILFAFDCSYWDMWIYQRIPLVFLSAACPWDTQEEC